MEYSFWGDDTGLHLAMHRRASHQKSIVKGCALAMPAIDGAANSICTLLNESSVRASDLKTIIVRCNQDGRVATSLFVKPLTFPKLRMPDDVTGLRVYHSSPKSPASVPSKLLYQQGDSSLQDTLLGKTFTYDVDSFFQVNVPIFERALQSIRKHCQAETLVDMYAGVGSIGLSIARKKVELIELDPTTAKMARLNTEKSQVDGYVIEASTEKALEYIRGEEPVIFDPPRAGLHDKVIDRILEARPPKIVYLSCNPATQARDLAKIQGVYVIQQFEVFNFFPRTPHIETLAILVTK
jgi:23S rRNA (uracil1939-C5)-methyltransferase